jgi:hypothetical protein
MRCATGLETPMVA